LLINFSALLPAPHLYIISSHQNKVAVISSHWPPSAATVTVTVICSTTNEGSSAGGFNHCRQKAKTWLKVTVFLLARVMLPSSMVTRMHCRRKFGVVCVGGMRRRRSATSWEGECNNHPRTLPHYGQRRLRSIWVQSTMHHSTQRFIVNRELCDTHNMG
jgi:hypothetical protein